MNNTSQKVRISIRDQGETNWCYIYSMHIPQIGDRIRMFAEDTDFKPHDYCFTSNKDVLNKDYCNDIVFDGVVIKREYLYDTNDFIKARDANPEAEKVERLAVHITLG